MVSLERRLESVLETQCRIALDILELERAGKISYERMKELLDKKIYDFEIIRDLLNKEIENEWKLLQRIAQFETAISYAKEDEVEIETAIHIIKGILEIYEKKEFIYSH